MHRAPKVRLEHSPRVFLADGLDFAQHTVRGVVHDDVYAPECGASACERIDNLLALGDVEREDENPFRRILGGEFGEGGRVARGRDYDLALLQDDICEESSEPGRCTGDCC